MTRPNVFPRFATSPPDPLNIQEPPEAKKDSGWLLGEKPPFEFFNWMQRLNNEWLQYQDTLQRFAPHQASVPDMTVVVDAGTIWDGETLIEPGQQTTSVIVAPATNDRIDRVVMSAVDGVVSVIAGSESATPEPPDLPAGGMPIAQVRLSPGMTEITNDRITDERTQLQFSSPWMANNLSAGIDPTANNDGTQGYRSRSLWFNTISGETFRCIDPATGAAIWVKTSLTIDELGTMATQNANGVGITGGTISNTVIDASNTITPVIARYKSSDTSRASTNTRTADPHLSGMQLTDGTYLMEASLIARSTSATPDLSLRFYAPGGVTSTRGYVYSVDSTGISSTVGNALMINGSRSISLNASQYLNLIWKGFLTVSGAATIDLEWAQLISDPSATTLHEGSYVKFTRI